MVHHKRTQSRWSVKAPAASNNAYDSELTKPGMRRSYSEDTDLSETGKISGNSSGDESWSGMSDSTPTPAKSKLSGEAGLFIPQQPVQPPSSEQRTRLSSAASVFVPGQMQSQQVAPTYAPQMPQTPVFMPQMMESMPYASPCFYMAPDGSTWGMCPVAMPVISGAPPPVDVVIPDESSKMPKEPESEAKAESLSPQSVGKPKPAAPKCALNNPNSPASNASGKTRWADLDDEDESDDPWLN